MIRSLIQPVKKRGQISSVIIFAGIILLLLFIAPFLLKIVTVPLNKFSSTFSTMSQQGQITNRSAEAVSFGETKVNNMFDWVIAIVILFNIITLMVSAFLVDVHPTFLIIYIFGAFFLITLAPTSIESLQKIYGSSSFTTESNNLPIMSWIVDNYAIFMLGIVILSAIIMYGKYRLSSGSGGGAYA